MGIVMRVSEELAGLPPLTDDERYRFMDRWLTPDTAAKLRAMPTDAEALRWLTWQRDNGGSGGPSGWQTEVTTKGTVSVVLKVVPEGAMPNRYGVYMGVAVRGARIGFDEIVRYHRHGRPAAQLALVI